MELKINGKETGVCRRTGTVEAQWVATGNSGNLRRSIRLTWGVRQRVRFPEELRLHRPTSDPSHMRSTF